MYWQPTRLVVDVLMDARDAQRQIHRFAWSARTSDTSISKREAAKAAQMDAQSAAATFNALRRKMEWLWLRARL